MLVTRVEIHFFLPTSVKAVKREIGEGKVIGEDGGRGGGGGDTMGCTSIISIVTTNVVLLCEYLPQYFPLWGTIKGYCIILYGLLHHTVPHI